MKQVVDFLPPDAIAYLRFPDGDVKFPVRPVPAGDFLIGSGADCDLRLGDGVLPPLHSVLRATAKDASWTRLVRSPELLINGESVRQSPLHDGDLVEIGPFRLIFRFASEQSEISLQELLKTDDRQKTNAGTTPVWSTHQLVEMLEQELRQLDELDRTAQHGIQELLTTIDSMFRRLRWNEQKTSEGRSDETRIQNALENDELHRLLQYQTEKIDVLSDVLEQVIQQQRVMADVLHGLTERLTRMSIQTSARRRAS